jgi:primase-polymerase (primpol)-like protein
LYLGHTELQKSNLDASDFFKLPAALSPLKSLNNWVCWRWKEAANGQLKKPPYQAKNPREPADINKPNTWSDYDTAMRAVGAGEADGIGFVLTGTPFAAFDLDDCIIDDDVAPWAKKLIEEAGSYTELTPSNEGMRIIGTAQGSPTDSTLSMPVGHLEIYRKAKRYITITGDCDGLPSEIKNIDAIIDATLPKISTKHAKTKCDVDEFERIKSALYFIPADQAR